jgi:hypothetical protein
MHGKRRWLLANLAGITIDNDGTFRIEGDSTVYFNLQSAIAQRDRQQRRIYQPSSRPTAPVQKPFYTNYDSRREQDMGRRSTKRKRVYNSLQASAYSLESVGFASLNIENDNRILRARWSFTNNSPANEDHR